MADVVLYRREAADGKLPMVCAVCGERAEVHRSHTFTRDIASPRHVPGGRIRYVQYVPVNLPFCARHAGYFRRYLWPVLLCFGGAAIGFAIAFAGGFLAIKLFDSPIIPFLAVPLGLLIIFASFITGVVLGIRSAISGIRPYNYSRNTLTLSGVSQRFADAVEGREVDEEVFDAVAGEDDDQVYDAVVPVLEEVAPSAARRTGPRRRRPDPRDDEPEKFNIPRTMFDRRIIWLWAPAFIAPLFGCFACFTFGPGAQLFGVRPPQAVAPPAVNPPAVQQPPKPQEPPKVVPQDPPAHKLAPGRITGRRGLDGYWAFDEGEGDRAKDASGHLAARPAQLVGTKWVDGVRGKALEFDGKSSHVDYGRGAAFDFPKGRGFTVAGWLRTTKDFGTVVSQRAADDGGAVCNVYVMFGQLQADVRRDKGGNGDVFVLSAHVNVNDGKWHHFAVTRKLSGELQIFADGKGHQRSNFNGGAFPITTDLRRLGIDEYRLREKWPGEQYFAGAIDEFCIFDRALPPDEIAELAVP